MLYQAKVAVCSDIRTKHINAAWALPRICGRYSWWWVKLPLGFKRLNTSIIYNYVILLYDLYWTSSKYLPKEMKI
jgi:hypothetical protein